MRSHLQGVALKLQTVKSHQAMAEAMQSTAKVMHKMNKAVNVPTITKMLADFERENQRTEMMQDGTSCFCVFFPTLLHTSVFPRCRTFIMAIQIATYSYCSTFALLRTRPVSHLLTSPLPLVYSSLSSL
jgi:hypothetical protein